MSIDQGMDKDDVMYIYIHHTHTHTHTYIYIYISEYYSVIKKNEIIRLAATWMDLEIIILSEVSQTEKQQKYDTTYMWDLKKKQYK